MAPMQAGATQGVTAQGKEKKGGDRDDNTVLSLAEAAAAADKARASAEEEEVHTYTYFCMFMNDG